LALNDTPTHLHESEFNAYTSMPSGIYGLFQGQHETLTTL